MSIVIPVYNCEDHIGETIYSVLNQSYTNIEILLIDDGSKDNTAKIIQDFKLKYPGRIKYFFQQNMGVSVARNNGIGHSSGEFIAFLDSDDIWHANKIEKQINELLKNNVDASCCAYIEFQYDINHPLKKVSNIYSGDLFLPVLKGEFWSQTSTWVVNKDFLLKNDLYFSPDFNWGEDIEFFTKVALLTKVCFIDEYLSYYRINTFTGLSQKSKQQNTNTLIQSEIEIWLRICQWLLSNVSKYKIENITYLLDIILKYRIPSIIVNKYYLISSNKRKILKEKDYFSEFLLIYYKKLYLINGNNSFKLIVKRMLVKIKIYYYLKFSAWGRK